MTAYAIETRELSFSFGYRILAVDKVSLKVPEGSIYGFLGPNGAGKTTTIRLLTGMLLSDADNILINGQSLTRNIPGIFQSIGTLIETPSLYLHLTGIENLRIITTLRDLPGSKIEHALATVGLTKAGKRKVKEYSLGMKQRLGIATALLPDPSLMILDEPANGLDPTGIIEVRELMKDLNRNHGKTIFVSSHLLNEVEKMCTHIGIIHKGKLLYQASIEDMRHDASDSGEVIVQISNAEEWISRIEPIFGKVKTYSPHELLFPFSGADEVRQLNKTLVGMDVPVSGIQVRGGLEEWFMRITQKDKQIV
jgi:ABC-type multidrug transport system ATPase subunit